MQGIYAENRLLMIEWINKSVYLDLACELEEAFYCFPAYRFEMGSVDLATRLIGKYHVATVPGLAFGDCGEGFLRLSYATTREEIKEAMERVVEQIDPEKCVECGTCQDTCPDLAIWVCEE